METLVFFIGGERTTPSEMSQKLRMNCATPESERGPVMRRVAPVKGFERVSIDFSVPSDPGGAFSRSTRGREGCDALSVGRGVAMTVEQRLLQTLHALPAARQQELLDFRHALSRLKPHPEAQNPPPAERGFL